MIYIQALGTDKVANQRTFDIIKRRYKFSKVIFVASKESIKYIPEGAEPDEIIIVDSDDIRDILRKLETVPEGELIVNITTGTKAMIAALVILAIRRKGRIVYIGGERYKEKVITGSEKIYEYDFR